MNLSKYDKLTFAILVLLVLSATYLGVLHLVGIAQKLDPSAYAVAVNQDGLLAGSSDNEIFLWKAKRVVGKLKGHKSTIKSLAFSNNGQFLVSDGFDFSVKVWSVADEEPLATLHTPKLSRFSMTGSPEMVKFSNTDELVICAGEEGNLRIWDWRKGKVLKVFSIEKPSFSISKNDVLALIGQDSTLRLIDLKSQKEVMSMKNLKGHASFFPDGKRVAVLDSQGKVKIINTESRTVIKEFVTEEYWQIQPLITPDGKFLMIPASNGMPQLWDVQTARLSKSFYNANIETGHRYTFINDTDLLYSDYPTIKVLNIATTELKEVAGGEKTRTNTVVMLAVIFLILLLAGFIGVYQGAENKLSTMVVSLGLVAWLITLLLLAVANDDYRIDRYVVYIIMILIIALLIIPNRFVKFVSVGSVFLTWIATVITILTMATIVLAIGAIFTIPVGLIFGFLSLRGNTKKDLALYAVLLNFFLTGVIFYLLLSQGIN